MRFRLRLRRIGPDCSFGSASVRPRHQLVERQARLVAAIVLVRVEVEDRLPGFGESAAWVLVRVFVESVEVGGGRVHCMLLAEVAQRLEENDLYALRTRSTAAMPMPMPIDHGRWPGLVWPT